MFEQMQFLSIMLRYDLFLQQAYDLVIMLAHIKIMGKY